MKKLSLMNAQGALSRNEMKMIMAGSGITCTCNYPGFSVTGSCSGPSVQACNGYACSGGGTNAGCS